MKKININTILLIILISMTLTGCSGEFDTFKEEQILSGDISTFLNKAKPNAQSFEIDAQQAQTLVSSEQHIIMLDEGTFGDEHSIIQLEYTASEKVGDLILNDQSTTMNRDILFIESIMTLNTKNNGNLVEAQKLVNILKPKTDANSDRALFQIKEGIWSKIEGNTAEYLETTEWETNTSTQTGFKAKVTTNQTYAIAKPLNLGNEAKTAFCVDITEGLNGINTNVYLQLKYSTNLIPLSWNSENMLFCDAFGDVIPVGFEARIISVSHHYDGRVLFGIENVVIESDMVYQLNPVEVSEAELKANLRVL